MDLEEEYNKIYRYCFFKLHHQQMAEDITQETFLRFLEQKEYCERGKKLRYLYTIAHHLCVDAYRKSKEEPLTDELPSEDMEDDMLTGIVVKAALRELSREEQELLLLRYANEVGVSDICSILHMSRFTVYRKTIKAIKQLQNILREEDFK